MKRKFLNLIILLLGLMTLVRWESEKEMDTEQEIKTNVIEETDVIKDKLESKSNDQIKYSNPQ